MALPATDAFTGTTGTQLTTYSANWTLNAGDFDIQSNALSCDAAADTDSLCHWNADAFDANQYAQVTMTAAGDYLYGGPAVRVHATDHTGYCIAADNSDGIFLSKVIDGDYTELAAYAAADAGDVLRLEVSGTTLTVKKNGGTLGTVVDSDISTGSGGLYGYWVDGLNRTDMRLDSFEAGNLAAAAIQPPRTMHQFMMRHT